MTDVSMPGLRADCADWDAPSFGRDRYDRTPSFTRPGSRSRMSAITSRTLACGATLVHEHIPGTSVQGFLMMLPVGTAGDAMDADGHAPLMVEYLFRGAGERDARTHSDALDRLGVQRNARNGPWRTTVSGTMLAASVNDGLPLLIDMVRAPRFDAEHQDAVRSLCLQTLGGLEDDPQHLVSLKLRANHLGTPLNRHGYGDQSVLETTDAATLKHEWFRRATPATAIIASAGPIAADAMAKLIDRELGDWTGSTDEPVEQDDAPRGLHHFAQETAQVHVAAAWDAPAESDEHSMAERLAMTALGGSTSGRLFTEVRQKRSLCYSVGASYRAGRDRGLVTLYAGTTPERAQETLDVCAAEIERLKGGLERDEFDRARIGLKSRLVMQGESTPARTGALASDQFRIGRPRGLDEVIAAVEAVDLDQVNAWLSRRNVGRVTVATIGPEALTMPGPLSSG